MAVHPRFPAGTHFDDTDNRSKGWYSRKHRTGDAHMAVKEARERREQTWAENFARRIEERAERTPAEQLAVLDARLGPNKGARKERARLKGGA